MSRKLVTLPLMSALLFLAACNSSNSAEPTIDINAIHTAAAQTVEAEFTQTAAAMPATLVPTAVLDVEQPTATATEAIIAAASPTQITCDNANFNPSTVDVTVQDGTEMSPGQDFVKTWKIKNIGSCTWGAGYGLIYAYGDSMEGVAEPLPSSILPGEEVEVSVRFKAPAAAGEYLSAWRMANANGVPFGDEIFVKIIVR